MLGATLRELSISKQRKFVHMVGNVFSIFKKCPRCARLGTILRKYPFPSLYVHMVGNIYSILKNVSALRALGDDIKKMSISKT